MLGGKWTETSTLFIQHAEWRAGDIPQDIFDNLSTFTGITKLSLDDVTLPSIAAFGRLACALPALEELICSNVSFETHHFNRAAFPRCADRMKLSEVTVYISDTSSIDDISRFFVSTRISAKLTRVFLGKSNDYPLHPGDFLSGSMQRLVQSAGASLRTLSLHLVPGEYPIDISHNAKLTKFLLLINIDNVDFNAGCIAQLVSQLTSKVMEEITIELGIGSMTINRPEELIAILTRLPHGFCPQLDDIFTRPVFDKLTDVRINVYCGAHARYPDEKVKALWKTLLQSQMPTLHKRGILGAFFWER